MEKIVTTDVVPVDGVVEDPAVVQGSPENWTLEDVAAALRVAMDDFETADWSGADLLWCGSRDA